MNAQKLSFLLLLCIALIGFKAKAQGDACKIVGELSLPILETGGITSCMASGNPAVCQIAFAIHNCSQDPACNGVVSTVIENGCVYSVEKIGKTIKIIGTSAKENVNELQRTLNWLNSIDGMLWIMTSLGG